MASAAVRPNADTECELPGLLGSDVLRPRAHQGRRARIPGVAFKGVAFEHPPDHRRPESLPG